MEFRKEQDEAQFLQSVMASSTSTPRTETSELLFHVDAKIDYFKDRVESRNERFQADLHRDFNELKTKLRRQSRRTNIFALLTIIVGFTAAYFAIYGKVTSHLENLVEQRAEHEFSSDKIQSLIASEAEKFTKERAQLLIQSKIDLAIHDVDAFKDSMTSKLKAIELEQTSVSKLIDANRASLQNPASTSSEGSKAPSP